MTEYLLTIELRKANTNAPEVGEIVVLSQAFCRDAETVLIELDLDRLTGGRFVAAVKALPEHTTERDIAADPRPTS